MTSLQDITATLAQADPADKAVVYAEMGIQITYHQYGQVLLESRPRVVNECVGGATRTINPPVAVVGGFTAAA